VAATNVLAEQVQVGLAYTGLYTHVQPVVEETMHEHCSYKRHSKCVFCDLEVEIIKSYRGRRIVEHACNDRIHIGLWEGSMACAEKDKNIRTERVVVSSTCDILFQN
jgi:hypothetical protein